MDDLKSKAVPFNLAEIKKLARQSLDEGAVTQDYPLDLKQAHKILNDALATEIMCFAIAIIKLLPKELIGHRLPLNLKNMPWMKSDIC